MKKLFSLLCVMLSMAVMSQGAYAQRDAGSKVRGDYYLFDSAGTYQNHAYDHARVLNQYATEGTPVPKAIIQEHANALRYNVESSKRAYSKVSDAATKNAEVAKLIASIKAHQEKALETCNMLDMEAKDDGDAKTVMKCCTEAEAELKAAAAEHEQLLKLLGIAPVAPAKK